MTDVDSVFQVQSFGNCGNIGSIGIHAVAIRRLRGASMATAIMGNYSITVPQEKHHLRVPIVSGEGPAVVEEERLTCALVLEINLSAIFGCDCCHGMVYLSCFGMW